MATRLKKEFINKILESKALQGLIAEQTGKSFTTIVRWAEDESQLLLLAPCLKAIAEFTGIKEDCLLEDLNAEKGVPQEQ